MTGERLGFVACDTGRWEQAAAEQLERLARDGIIECYARNGRLQFVIPYTFQSNDRGYQPDFIVRCRGRFHLIVEIKGMERPETPAKHEAANRWVRAVNRWRRLGEWDFLVCREPARLGEQIRKRITERDERIRAQAERLLEDSRHETERLKERGWTREDFARSLMNLLERG